MFFLQFFWNRSRDLCGGEGTGNKNNADFVPFSSLQLCPQQSHQRLFQVWRLPWKWNQTSNFLDLNKSKQNVMIITFWKQGNSSTNIFTQCRKGFIFRQIIPGNTAQKRDTRKNWWVPWMLLFKPIYSCFSYYHVFTKHSPAVRLINHTEPTITWFALTSCRRH